MVASSLAWTALAPTLGVSAQSLATEPPLFPQADRLGRVIGGRVPVYARPDSDSPQVGSVLDDDVVVWLRELTGRRVNWQHQRFVETPDGYIYAPNLHPVRNLPNQPMVALPGRGMWAEISLPYVDVVLKNPPPRSPWLQAGAKPRLYYSQVFWVDEIRRDEQGQVLYSLRERYGTFGDVFWAPAEALRPITPEELSPISPDVEEKQVVVNLTHQTMSCMEAGKEVFYCRVSTGGKFDNEGKPSDTWSTSPGSRSIWRKMVSVHMTGGSTGGGYDLPGIAWTTLFSGNGIAIHSTFWHNSYGIPRSHGCVNARPGDANWVFRWTLPQVPYEPGDVIISGLGSSKVVVVER